MTHTKKKKAWVAIAVLASASAAGAAPDETSPDAVEPPLELRIEGLGKEPIAVRLDTPFDLPAGPARRVVLRASPTRLFERGAVRFRYPSAFGFELELDEGDASWTLSGNDAKVIVWRFAEPLEPTYLDDYAKAIAKELAVDGEPPSPTRVTLRLGRREVGGLRVEGKAASMRVRNDVVVFQAGGTTWSLVVQDAPPDEATQSAEAKAVIALLAETFESR